jgi:hypothetical protein
MEDWNTKMDKRLQQISELVLLANAWVLQSNTRVIARVYQAD